MASDMSPKSAKQAFYFLLSGATGFAIYYVLSNALHYLVGMAAVPAALVAMLASVFPTYYMQKNLTFRSQTPSHKALPRYLLLQVLNASVIGSATYAFDRMQVPQAVNFALAGFMSVVVSFFVQNKFIFRDNH